MANTEKQVKNIYITIWDNYFEFFDASISIIFQNTFPFYTYSHTPLLDTHLISNFFFHFLSLVTFLGKGNIVSLRRVLPLNFKHFRNDRS